MKIIHINFSDIKGGANRAAYRLHKGFIDQNIVSRMLVQRKYSTDPTVESCYGNSKTGFVYGNLRSKLDGLVNKLQQSNNPITHNSNWLPSRLHTRINNSDADIVHLHWIGRGMLSIREIGRIEKPIVWTLHDMWAFSGSEHYDDLNSPKRYKKGYYQNNRPDGYTGWDIDRWTWKRKMKHWSDQELNIVTPSNWLANCAKESLLFKDQNVNVIPYTIDLNVYKPISESWAREILNLPDVKDRKYILFGAISATSDQRKGFQLLQKAFSQLRNKHHHLLVFGSEGYNSDDFGVATTYLGRLNDDETLALAYSAADIMVVPSLQDNLPLTAVEAVACGTPVVAFNIGGLPDIVDHKENGYLAEPYSPKDLSEGIAWTLEDEKRNDQLGEQARAKAVEKFKIEKVANQYKEFYETLT